MSKNATLNPYQTLFAQQPAHEPVTKAIIYARVSESGRDDTVTSLNKQCDDCRRVAKEKHLPVAGVFTDDRQTGGNTNRPGLRQAIAMARKERAAIVAYDLDRLSRSVKDSLEILEKLADAGIPVIICTGLPVDMTTPHGRLIVQLLGMVNEYYRANQAKLTKEALNFRKKAGKAIGPAPYGWRKEHDNRLEPIPRQQKMIRWVVWRFSQGFGAAHLNRELLLRGYQKHKGLFWTPASLIALHKKWKEQVPAEPVELDFWDNWVNLKISQGEVWERKTVATMPNLILHRSQVPTAEGKWPHYYSGMKVAPSLNSAGQLMLPLDQIRQEQHDTIGLLGNVAVKTRKWIRAQVRVPARVEDVDPLLIQGFHWKPSAEAAPMSLREAREAAADEFGPGGIEKWLGEL